MKRINFELDEEDVQSLWAAITKLEKHSDIHIRGIAVTLKHRVFGRPKEM